MSYSTHVGGSVTNTSFTSYSSNYIYHDGETFPTGRAAKSGTPVHVSSFTPDSASGASGIAGYCSPSSKTTSGGTCQVGVSYSSGTLNFGRNNGGGGVIVDAADSSTWNGSIPGTLTWEQGPTAPTGVTVTPATAQATVAWTTPSDNGQSAITGYRVYYSTASNMAGASFVDVGVVNSTVITGLTPGTTYYFTVSAKNAVTTAASTVGIESSIISAYLSSGGKVWNGSAWIAGNAKVWNGSAWVAATVKVWNGSAWTSAL